MATHGPVCRLGLACLLVGASLAKAQTPVAPTAEPQFFTAEQAVEARRRGRAWLLQRQNADGSWTAKIGYENRGFMGRDEQPHVGVTALAGLALLDRGEHALEARRRQAVEQAATWLSGLGGTSAYGYITAHGTRMMEHAYGTQFLAELQRRRPDPAVEEMLGRACGLIVRSQSDEGGWRYQPFARDADVVCTVVALEALYAAREAGIEVPRDSLVAALDYVARCGRKNTRDQMFSYQDLAPANTFFTFGCTATGVFALGRFTQQHGSEHATGLRFLQEQYLWPKWGELEFLFGHYYASRAVRWEYPEGWRDYARHLREEFVRRQKPDGSWEDPVGEVYATAMACLILEVCAGP